MDWNKTIRILYGNEEEEESPNFEIVEEASGNWSYHIKSEGEVVCGFSGMTMSTSFDPSQWGSEDPDHINMSWCEECEKKFEE